MSADGSTNTPPEEIPAIHFDNRSVGNRLAYFIEMGGGKAMAAPKWARTRFRA